MKKVLAIFLPVVLLSLCSCAAIFTKIAEKWIDGLAEMMQEAREVNDLVTRFKEANHRWPATEEELQAFTNAKQIPFDWSRYSQVHFKERKDGSVEVSLTCAPPKNGVLTTVVGGPEQSTRLEVSAGIGTGSR